jgi:hypothetical protein
MAGVSDADVLNGQKNAMLAIGAALQAILGSGPWFDGLACTPGSGLNISLAPGSVFQQLVTDATGYGSLGTDAAYTTKGGLVRTTSSFACPAPTTAGQSINYLVEGQYQDVDGGSTLLPYYDSANPSIPYSGPANDGIPQTTVRQAVCALRIKAGSAAATGSQTTPAPDAGWSGLWAITVPYGATSITSGEIALYPGAPFITLKLPQIPPYLVNLVQSFNGRGGVVTLSSSDVVAALGFTPANKAGDTFTGPVSGPTPASGDSSTKLATTAFINASLGSFRMVEALYGTVGAITFTTPANIVGAAFVIVTGGGGGSGGSTSTVGGAGGGAGGTVQTLLTLTSGQVVTGAVGAGGTAGASGAIGGAGGPSSFGAITANGGGGGQGGPSFSAGGAPGYGSGGDLIIQGGFGVDGMIGNNNSPWAIGGASFWGGGGRAGDAGGLPGSAYGAGGGGTYGAAGAGAAGAPGVIVVRYWTFTPGG